MSAIIESTRSPAPLGARRAWSLDLACVGAITTLALGVVSPLSVSTVVVAAALSALGGVALGGLVPTLLAWRVRRKPVVLLLVAGVGLGACWLGFASAGAALLTGTSWTWALSIGASAGAVQLGWLWLPMVLARAKGRSTVEYVLLACLASPLVGYLAFRHVTCAL